MAEGLGLSGTVDPTTLYTKQQCIGGGSFGKVYKGYVPLEAPDLFFCIWGQG